MKFRLLTLASAAAFLAACGDSSVSDANDEIKETATFVFTTFDANTRMPVEDVKIYYRLNDESKFTDSTGTVVWKNIEIGKSYFDISKEGYVSKRVEQATKENIQNDVARVDDEHIDVPMHEIGVEAKGQFFYKDISNGNLIPAKNVTIYAKYTGDNEIYPNEVFTTTDSNGFYSFKDMAAGVEFTINSERFVLDSTNIVYEAVSAIAKVNERKGVIKELDPKNAGVAGLVPVLLASNLSKLSAESSLKLTFSEVLDKDSVKTKYVSVFDANDNNVSTVVSLSEDGKTISIKPTSGSWVDGNSYKVAFSVWSTAAIEDDDADGFRDFDVGTIKIPSQVKNFKLDTAVISDVKQDIFVDFYGTHSAALLLDDDATNDTIKYDVTINLIWDEMEKGAKGYRLYTKGNAEENSDYTFYAKYDADVKKTAVTLSKALYGSNIEAKYPINKKQSSKISMILVPFNTAGEALASKATVVEVNVAEAAEKEMKKYQDAKLKNLAKPKFIAGNGCLNETIASCNTEALADMFQDDYFTMNISFEWTWEKDYKFVPDGYDIYFKDEKEGWKYVAYVTYPTNSFALTWQYKEAMKSSDKDEDVTVAVVPFFNNATYGYISATDLSKFTTAAAWKDIE